MRNLNLSILGFLSGLFLLIAMLISCQDNSSIPVQSNKLASNIVYFEDKRTNLCFAALNSYTYGGYAVTSITNIPCVDFSGQQ